MMNSHLDWTQIILAVISTGIITTVLNHFFGKKKENVDIYETYLRTVNERIDKLERRQYRYEIRDAIHSSAVNCAHKCEKPDEDCPVLQYLEHNPLPEKLLEEE